MYLEYPDLTGKGQECSVRFLASGFEEGVKCFQEVGYTLPCAEAWMYNVINTRDSCFDTCFDFTFLGDGVNNGPPPSCKLADCLNCDEVMSGPGFQTVAARSRRRSGLLSKIVRDCDNLLIVDHKEPCKVSQADVKKRSLQGEQSSEKPEQPEKYRPPTPTETCVYMDTSFGLGGYAATQGNTVFSLVFGGDRYDSTYTTCVRYDWNSVLSGFWQNQREIFGAAYGAAVAFATIAAIIGGVTTVFTWCSLCVVYSPKTWRRMAWLYVVCSICLFLTMSFFASGICDNGCSIEKAGILSIVSGFVWLVTAGLAWKSTPRDSSIPKSSCCCCPMPLTTAEHSVYMSIPTKDVGSGNDGSIIVQEVEKGVPEEDAMEAAQEEAQEE